jgi:hypothetical protein
VPTKTKSGGGSNEVLASANKALETPIEYEAFLATLGTRDRVNVERHVAAAEADPDHARLWKRACLALATLAPLPPQTTGQHAVSFFVPDGKYKMQVFALEDQRDGKVVIYAPDVLDEAVKAGVLTNAGKSGEAPGIRGAEPQSLPVELLSAQNTPNPQPFYKHMLGWNRLAMKITLLVTASDQQLRAAAQLCAIAARRWQQPATAAAK